MKWILLFEMEISYLKVFWVFLYLTCNECKKGFCAELHWSMHMKKLPVDPISSANLVEVI